MKRLKTLLIFVLTFIMLCGCAQPTLPQSSKDTTQISSQGQIRYIQLQTIGLGKITISKSYAVAGESVTFTAIPYPNYMVSSIMVYDTKIENINNSMAYGYTFTMQDKETVVIATFVSIDQESSSSSSQSSLSSSSSSSIISSSSSEQSSSSLVESSTSSQKESISSSSSQSSLSSSSSSSIISSSSSSVSSSSNKPSSVISSSTSSSSSFFDDDDDTIIEETDNVKPTLQTIDTGVSNIGDPYILADKNTNKYYIYATVNGEMSARGFKVWESTNLKNWTDKGICYEEVNYGTGRTPFDNEYWAPEVVYNPATRKYIMFFSARVRANGVKKLGVAIGDSPLGPFRHEDGLGVMFDESLSTTAYIDAHFFLDDDGQAYLLYCNDCSKNSVNGVNTSQTWIRKLDSTWTKVVGAGKMISTPTQAWETQEDADAPNTQWNEGPALYKHNGKYYLMYSANPYWNSLYGVGCAVADNIWGEYIKYDWNPILVKVEGATSGPGHNMLFKDFNGNLWASYHRHTYNNNPNGDRTAMLSPAWFDNGILKVEYGQKYEEETTHKDTNKKPQTPTVDYTEQPDINTINSNITGIGDPFVLADPNSKKYYMYATSDVGNGYKVWESCDLINWTDMGTCFNKNTASSFAYQDFWSPEVVYNPNTRQYIMYYTGRNTALRNMGSIPNDGSVAGDSDLAYNTGVSKIGVAVAESPFGPFISVEANKPMFDLGVYVATCDATLFVDDNGEAYLYYVKDAQQNRVDGKATSQIYGVKVDSTWTKTVGEHYLIATPDNDWEIESSNQDGVYKNEAPFVYKYNGTYYLTYSANMFTSTSYAVGVATSNNPLTGFVKDSSNPIMKGNNRVGGPGHVMIFKDFNGYLRASYHVQVDRNNYSGNRKMAISAAWFDNGKLTIEYNV